MASDGLPFPDVSAEGIVEIIKAPPSSKLKRFGVTTRPLAPNLEVDLVPQEHIWLDKKKVYNYLRSLYPYPEFRGSAYDEINNADSALFDVYRIPKPGHCPAGLQGVVYDIPSEVSSQTPLSLELVGKGREIIIEAWPPSYPKIPSPSPPPLSPAEQQHQLQLEGPPMDDGDDIDVDDDDDVFGEFMQDGQEILPSLDGLLDSPVRGEKSKDSGSVDVASVLGGMIDDLQDGLVQDNDDIEVFKEPEVFADDSSSSFPVVDNSLPPIALEEFVGPPGIPSRRYEIRNNGTIRFVVVNRLKSTAEWKVSPWSLASLAVNEVMNACFADNLACFKSFHWANPWRGSGLLSLFSSYGSLDMMNAFRRLFTEVQVDGFDSMEFNTYPKDLLPSTTVTLLLKTALKNFNPKHIPTALFNQNSGLSGSLKLHSSRPISTENFVKSKKGESKVGWRIITLKGNQMFFSSLKLFSEAHPFHLGCSHVHIRGGTGRPRVPKKTGSTSSSSSSSAAPVAGSTSAAPISLSSSTSSSSSSDGQILSSVVVPDISKDVVLVPDEELSQLFSSQSQTSVPRSGIVAAAMAAASSSSSADFSQRSTRSCSSQAQTANHPKSSSKFSRPQTAKVQPNVKVPPKPQSGINQGTSKNKPKNRGRGFIRDKKADSKKNSAE